MSYDNPIIGFEHKGSQFCGFNYILKNGEKSSLPLKYSGGKNYQTVKIFPPGAIVRKVVMNAGGVAGMINGVQFFDKDDN